MIEQVCFDFEEPIAVEEVVAAERPKAKRMEVGDLVVVSATPDFNQSIETYYYLSDFTNQKGTLVRINRQTVVSFEVEFPKGRVGVFYEDEITKK